MCGDRRQLGLLLLYGFVYFLRTGEGGGRSASMGGRIDVCKEKGTGQAYICGES